MKIENKRNSITSSFLFDTNIRYSTYDLTNHSGGDS